MYVFFATAVSVYFSGLNKIRLWICLFIGFLMCVYGYLIENHIYMASVFTLEMICF